MAKNLGSIDKSQQKFSVVTLESRELETKSVVVFRDRAEVKRLVRLDNVNAGRILININNVSPMIARESIRVEGQLQGAIIVDVEYNESPQFCSSGGFFDCEDGEKMTEMERKTADLELECISLNDGMEILNRQLEVLDGVAKQIGKNAIVGSNIRDSEKTRQCNQIQQNQQQQNGQKQLIQNMANKNIISNINNNNNEQSDDSVAPTSLFLLTEDSTNNLTKFLSYYAKTASCTRKELREKNRELGKFKDQLAKAEWELNKQRGKLEYDKNNRSISLLVDVHQECGGQVQLFLVYQVYSCSWRPAYSLRASTSAGGTLLNLSQENVSKEDGPGPVMLSYHGLVEQNTDENWNETELVLSTAQPCSANTIPNLPTIQAMLQKTAISDFRQRNFSSATNRRSAQISHASQEDLDAGIGSFDCNELVDAQQFHLQQIRAAATATGNGSENDSSNSSEPLPSTHFPVDYPCTIVANGQPHKVDIAHIELIPAYWHECVPSRLASAFLNAKLANSSQLPLLPGPLSLFFNNCYMSTTHLKLVMPGEEFKCLLGVDPAVKVEYKKASHSCEQQNGFISKKNVSTHEQVISLRNAKANQSVQVTVREPIPKTTDGFIKVVLLQPDLIAMKNECRLNKEHNLEWTIELGPGDQRDLTVKWMAEYPAKENVIFSTGDNLPSYLISQANNDAKIRHQHI